MYVGEAQFSSKTWMYENVGEADLSSNI
jgi:hypothetical protein